MWHMYNYVIMRYLDVNSFFNRTERDKGVCALPGPQPKDIAEIGEHNNREVYFEFCMQAIIKY